MLLETKFGDVIFHKRGVVNGTKIFITKFCPLLGPSFIKIYWVSPDLKQIFPLRLANALKGIPSYKVMSFMEYELISKGFFWGENL